jgi:N-acetyl-anhydromuramyl-L-alanine amidase AmpD
VTIKYSTHHTPNKSARTQTPIYIAIHRMQGSFDGTVAYFEGSASQVSADRCVSRKGDRVAIFNTASSGQKCWAVGNANSLSMSIENEGFVGDEKTLTDEFFHTLAVQCKNIQKEIKAKYGVTIPLKRTTTKGKAGLAAHHDLGVWYGGSDHSCPGLTFPWGRLEKACADLDGPVEFLEVTTGRGERKRFILGNHARTRAVARINHLLKIGRKKIFLQRKKG